MSVQDVEEPQGPNLAERIRRLANGRTTLDVAQFQFIGLTDIRARYGERWPAKRERVQTVARNFISKRLAHEDVLIPGADGFLVVFGAAVGPLADVAANRISKELNEFFIGSDPEDADVRFEAHRASMSVDDLAQAFGALIIEDAPPPPPRGELTVPHDPNLIRFVAQPVWDAVREALNTYFIAPVDARTGERLDAAYFGQHADATRSHVELDELRLKASEEAIRRLFAAGKKAFVGVSLHVASLNHTASLTRLFAVMSKFDQTLLRYRVVRIAGVEPGFPRIYLEDIARTLKSRIPNVAVGLNWNEPDIATVLRLQPASIGFSLSHQALSPHGPRAEMFSRIHAAAHLARAHDTPVFVEGDITPDLAARFVAEGVQMIASQQIWPASSELCAAQRWPAARLPMAGATAA